MPLRVRVPVGEKSIDVYFIFGSLEVTGPKKVLKYGTPMSKAQ